MTTGNSPKLYIAGMGMITPVGKNVAITAAAVNAGISGYKQSPYFTKEGEPITMALVPDQIFGELNADIDEGNFYNEQHDRIIKMAIIALKETYGSRNITQPIPLILATHETEQNATLNASQLIRNISTNCQSVVIPQLTRSISTGRASGMEALEFAFNYLYQQPNEFLLVGGSDSHCNYHRLAPFDSAGRLKTQHNADSFVPGEAACFLLLTRYPELALVRNDNVIALHPPGIADEPGHLKSEEPYRGDGLDRAFKKALVNHSQKYIHSIYSSMNGENHWAKEYGVAFLRNRKNFIDQIRFEHPADRYGDIGAATTTALITLAAENLFKNTNANSHLVYASSDSATRGAIVVEKIRATITANDKHARNFKGSNHD